MKQRISGLDLKILARELRSALESYRLTNIYNVADSSKQFLLKFGKPDSKINVVVDSGSKIHITTFTRHTPEAPSGFVSKLRKHLKGKRLTGLRQIPNDRILVLQFADGLYYLILEFFSAGNVMLLDEDRRILSLQRIVSEHENQVGETYTMFDKTLFEGEYDSNVTLHDFSAQLVSSWFREVQDQQKTEPTITSAGKNKKKNKKLSIHKLLLRKEPQLSSDLLSNNLKKAGYNPSEECLKFVGKEDVVSKLLAETQEEYVCLIEKQERCGYIVTEKNVNFDPKKHDQDLEYIYENFHPFIPFVKSEDDGNIRVIDIKGNYNKTVDTFFSTIESNKLALRIQNQEIQAQKKIDDARMSSEKKIQALVDSQSSNEHKAELIVSNADLVEQARAAVQNLIDQQTDWNTIEKLIQSEQRKGNEIAQTIELPLLLKRNKINIKLPDVPTEGEAKVAISGEGLDNLSDASDSPDSSESDLSDTDSESEYQETSKMKKKALKKQNDTPNTISVTIDLALSAYANASNYFTVKKSGAEKQKKAEKNLEKAMKNIEVLKKIRTPYFFEKYNWFISSEGFLVLHGKSPLETDQIYSKYIEDGDIYMSNSFDTHVWIKNPDKTEVPPNTLMQAGVLCMSSSSAWSKKVSSSAWWCHAKNVSKFDDHGCVLPTGVYRIKKESAKTLLSPSQLVMGIAFLWNIKGDGNNADVTDNDNDSVVLEDEPEHIEHEKSLEEPQVRADSKSIANDTDNIPSLKSGNFPSDDYNIEAVDLSLTDGTKDFSEVENNDTVSVATTTRTSKASKNVRGKKGKLKKIQRKYGDQDEEERLLRLEALGTLKGMQQQEEKERVDMLKQEEREYKKKQREKQLEKQTLKFTSTEKVHENYESFRKELKSSLNKDDQVVDIIPVFAPWSALQKYKYKVKIQPGNAKKTKSMTEVLHYFLNRKIDNSAEDKEMDWPVEHKLIKGVNENDLIPLLCVDKLNVSLPNNGKSKSKGPQGKAKSGKNSKKRK
ncbi:hypothetical protein C6P45_002997 [Maudiozyma exigua]|uniref:Ribosome quality control complex subunit 2 n=1 Tax=Maudiozyma exigua TaxID=34358 RepID=A0A9P6VVY6_MAUEX|nr:hypothetical protein C6P45_002997 [Kazachstania exigua]